MIGQPIHTYARTHTVCIVTNIGTVYKLSARFQTVIIQQACDMIYVLLGSSLFFGQPVKHIIIIIL